MPGIKIEESNSGKRLVTVAFTSKKLGEFKLKIVFPTIYPHGAVPIFDFLAPVTPESAPAKVEIKKVLPLKLLLSFINFLAATNRSGGAISFAT